jgi:hypothetical protein
MSLSSEKIENLYRIEKYCFEKIKTAPCLLEDWLTASSEISEFERQTLLNLRIADSKSADQ